MSPFSFIDLAERRLRRKRWLNLLSGLSLPLLWFLASLLLFFAPGASLYLKLAAAALCLPLLWKGYRFVKRQRAAPSREQATFFVDRALATDERLSALETLSQEDPRAALIERQLEDSGLVFDRDTLQRITPYSLTESARRSLKLLPLPLALMLLTASSFGSQRSLSTTPQNLQLQSAVLEEIDELIAEEESPEVRRALESLSEAVREEGLYSEEAIEAVDAAIQESEVAIALSSQSSGPEQPEPGDELQQEDSLPEPASQGESASSSQQPPAEEMESSPERNKATEPDRKSGEKSSDEKKGDSSEQKQEEQTGEDQQGSDGGSDEQNKGKDNDSSGQNSQQSSEDSRSSNKGSKRGSKEGAEEGSDKKDSDQGGKQGSSEANPGEKPPMQEQQEGKTTVGVGEGKGKTNSGAKQEQQGETQSGSDSRGAKQGDAKNESGAKEQESNTQSKTGKRLQELKNRIENNPSGAAEKKEKNAGGKKGADQKADGDAEKEQKSGQASSKGEKQKGPEASDSADQKGKDASKPQSGAQDGSDKKKGEQKQRGEKPQNKDQDNNQEKKGGEENRDKSSASAASSDKDAAEKSSGKQGNSGGGSERQGKPKDGDEKGKGSGKGSQAGTPLDARSAKPENSPDGKAGERGGGSGAGALRGNPDPKLEKFSLETGEETIGKGELGSASQKLYKSVGGLSARTKLGKDDFVKPESAEAGRKQPIPLEYREALR